MRLIDAEQLLERYNGNILTARTDYAEGCRDIIEDIWQAPTIDAVPVVRCRDCIYSKPNDGKLCEGARYCTMHTDGYTLDTVWDCDFCSYGEHRKSEK